MKRIQVRDLSIRIRDKKILDHVSLTISEGESVAIVGPNGAGKTMLVECILGLQRPKHGTIDNDFASLKPYKVGVVLQDSEPNGLMKVRETLDLFRFEGDWAPLVASYGLADKLNQRVATLSGGEKQKLQLILALQNEPEILFVDEMTTGLDFASRSQTVEMLKREYSSTARTLVVVTHYLEEAERLVDRLVLVNKGRIVADGSIDGLCEAHGIGKEIVAEVDGAGDALLHIEGARRSGGAVHIPIDRPERMAEAMNAINADSEHVKGYSVAERSLERLYNRIIEEGCQDE